MAEKPLNTINVNTSRRANFYPQGQQRAARILRTLTLWLLASCSPGGTLAVHEPCREAIAPVASPWDLSPVSSSCTLQDSPEPPYDNNVASIPAMERCPQPHISQEATPDEPLPFQARGGESVRFHYHQGQWRAKVSSRIGPFSRQTVLPVVCSQGENVASSLEVLYKYPIWYSQRQIHVLGENVCPTLGKVVYVGELGLRGGWLGRRARSKRTAERDQVTQDCQNAAAEDSNNPTIVTTQRGGLYRFFIIDGIPYRSIAGLVCIGLAQIAAGCFLTSYPLGEKVSKISKVSNFLKVSKFFNFSKVLVIAGVKYMLYAVKCGINREVKWPVWKNEVTSYVVLLGLSVVTKEGQAATTTQKGLQDVWEEQIRPQLSRGIIRELGCYVANDRLAKTLVSYSEQRFIKQITEQVKEALANNDVIQQLLGQDTRWEKKLIAEIDSLNLDFQMPNSISKLLGPFISILHLAQNNELAQMLIAIFRGIASGNNPRIYYAWQFFDMVLAGLKICWVTKRLLNKFIDQISTNTKYTTELPEAQQQSQGATDQPPQPSQPQEASTSSVGQEQATMQLVDALVAHIAKHRTEIIQNDLIMPANSMVIDQMLNALERWLADKANKPQKAEESDNEADSQPQFTPQECTADNLEQREADIRQYCKDHPEQAAQFNAWIKERASLEAQLKKDPNSPAAQISMQKVNKRIAAHPIGKRLIQLGLDAKATRQAELEEAKDWWQANGGGWGDTGVQEAYACEARAKECDKVFDFTQKMLSPPQGNICKVSDLQQRTAKLSKAYQNGQVDENEFLQLDLDTKATHQANLKEADGCVTGISPMGADFFSAHKASECKARAEECEKILDELQKMRSGLSKMPSSGVEEQTNNQPSKAEQSPGESSKQKQPAGMPPGDTMAPEQGDNEPSSPPEGLNSNICKVSDLQEALAKAYEYCEENIEEYKQVNAANKELVDIYAQLKLDPNKLALQIALQIRQQDLKSFLTNSTVYHRLLQLGMNTEATRQAELKEANDWSQGVCGIEGIDFASAHEVSQCEARAEDCAKVLDAVQKMLGVPSGSPPLMAQAGAFARGVCKSGSDTVEMFVDVATFVCNIGKSVVTGKDEAGLQEFWRQVCDAFCSSSKLPGETPEEYAARKKALEDIQKLQDLHRRVVDSHNCQLYDTQQQGRLLGHGAQLFVGPEVLNILPKVAGRIFGAAKGAQVAASLEKAAALQRGGIVAKEGQLASKMVRGTKGAQVGGHLREAAAFQRGQAASEMGSAAKGAQFGGHLRKAAAFQRGQAASEMVAGEKLGKVAEVGAKTRLLPPDKFPNLSKKFSKHSGEWSQWGEFSEEIFYKRAVDLADSLAGGHIREFVSKQGWIFKFNSNTGEFLTIHPNGHIETFFRPEQGLDYYLKQVQIYGD